MSGTLRTILALGVIAALGGCYTLPDNGTEAQKRVGPGFTCDAMGYASGNAQYDHCVTSERLARRELTP